MRKKLTAGLQQWLAPLSAAESSALLRELSDIESGSPRQWLLLEAAAACGAAASSRRVRLLGSLARAIGIAPLLPLWRRLHLPAIELYLQPATKLGRCARQALDDASLLLVALCALLAGFDRLPASRQFVVCLLLLLGGVIKAWRIYRQFSADGEMALLEETLPGAEAALGLQGLLLARGSSPAETRSLLLEWRSAPESGLSGLLAALPELAPPAPRCHEYVWAALAAWTLALLPALWLNRWQWGWLLALLWVVGLAWLAHRRRTFILLLPGVALASFLLARIAHLI